MVHKKYFIGVMIGLTILAGLLSVAFLLYKLVYPEPPYDGLAGTKWQLEAVWVKDTNLFLPPFVLPIYRRQTLEFKSINSFVGSDGCNSFGGEPQLLSFKERLWHLWHGYPRGTYNLGYQAWPDGRFLYRGSWSTLVGCMHTSYNVMASAEEYLQTLHLTYRYELRTTPLELIVPDTQQRVLLDKQLWLYYIDSNTGEEKALVFGPFIDTP